MRRQFHGLVYIVALVALPVALGYTSKSAYHWKSKIERSHFSGFLTLGSASVSDEISQAPPGSETSESKSYLDDGFVFGLANSGLDRPFGKQDHFSMPTAQLVVDGDTLETQPWQVALVLTTFLCHGAFASNAFTEMLSVNHGNIQLTLIQSFALLVTSWLVADLGSGILHWSVDNYGNGRTPVMGGVIAAFQGHHSAPWTITKRGFCNNVYKLCIPFGFAPMAAIDLLSGPHATMFFTFFCVMEIMSQEFHKWSHMTKSECPQWGNQFQNLGLTIGRKPHAQHHLPPYDGNYCIVSGVWNSILDKSGFFRRLEHVIYQFNGVESNAWKLDPQLRSKTLLGDYSQDL
eukprot:scaffold5529_cov117-Cylindrotheca_fusiformis.AAC.17